LRYADPNNKKSLIDPDKAKYWLPVDLYVGGAEHAVLHLLYSRFWIKVLYDVGAISFKEPFLKLKNQGLIMAPDGQKMSKSRGNVINPDDIIKKYGADTLRFYEMFMGPFEDSIAWDTKGIEGCSRFFKRFWNFAVSNPETKEDSRESLQVLNRLIKKIGEDIDGFKFNTAVSAFMGALNNLEKQKISKGSVEKMLILISPFAPHIAEELWEMLGHKESVFSQKWPEYDEGLIKEETVNLIIQINSRIRDRMDVSSDISKEEAERLTFQRANVIKWIQGKEVKKVIFIPGRLINIVI
jgi:leucyl-tRNA synthetase